MGDRLLKSALAMLFMTLAVSGCTNNVTGQAASGPSTPPSAGPISTAPSVRVSIPQRPADLRLDGIDPCALFTQAHLTQLQLDRKRSRTNQSQAYKGMAECSLDRDSQPYDHYAVTAATNEGVEEWFTGKRNVQSTLSSVAGFPSATFWIAGANGRNADACSVGVGVAQGQQLIVDSDNDGKRTYTLEQLCQRAERAAGMAVETLKTLK